uniref:Exostosin GT47 domain-containing protein n=1 Tax=Cannabis sativa TaxID=3483 RepID=A0A803NFI7_CANSA
MNSRTATTSGNSNTSLVKKKRKSESVDSDLSKKGKNAAMNKVSKRIRGSKMPVSGVYSVSEMNNLLIQSHGSNYSGIPQWSSAVDHELQDVVLQIENAPVVENDPNLYAPLYRNVSIFKRSYELMKQTLKVYIYKEGERPILHTPILQGIYASEGWFMKQLEANEEFVTKDPHKAHLFYLPFSSQMLREKLYVPNSHKRRNIVTYLKNYLDMIAAKYPFWKRTGGADHFLVACHDWAPKETSRYMGKCIRALCNADVGGGFVFAKDVSLPQTYIYSPNDTLRDLGGKPASERSTLAFFAGRMHGYLRPILLEHWENKDPDMKIFGKLPKTENAYTNYMKSSKYCISAKGYQVNSPRVIEAIFYECVPVIISDNYVPPFFDVLNWESFAVFVLEKDIPNLKKILVSIPEKRYREMQMRVKRVQQHFLWHGTKPVDYDMFHMANHVHNVSACDKDKGHVWGRKTKIGQSKTKIVDREKGSGGFGPSGPGFGPGEKGGGFGPGFGPGEKGGGFGVGVGPGGGYGSGGGYGGGYGGGGYGDAHSQTSQSEEHDHDESMMHGRKP